MSTQATVTTPTDGYYTTLCAARDAAHQMRQFINALLASMGEPLPATASTLPGE